jgi:hypothetical protein
MIGDKIADGAIASKKNLMLDLSGRGDFKGLVFVYSSEKFFFILLFFVTVTLVGWKA